MKRLITRHFAAVAIAGLALVVPTSDAQLSFTFNYTDVGVGFNDPTEGAARRASLEATVTMLNSILPGLTGSLNFNVDGSETSDGTLAAAGSTYDATCGAAGFTGGGHSRTIALGGADPDPAKTDGTITVNFEDNAWDYDDTIDPAKFDFKSTLLHELLHALGFSHTLSNAGMDPCGSNPGSFAPFDDFLGDSSSDLISAAGLVDVGRWDTAKTGGAGNAGVLWRGVAKAPVPLYSPNPISDGSSFSHVDDDHFTSRNLLMEAATGMGLSARTLSAEEIGIMKDIGYTSAIPVDLEAFSVE